MATEFEGHSSFGKDSSERKSINILVLGNISIGKTALIRSYCDAIDLTVEDLDIEELDMFAKYPVQIMHNETAVDVGLIDMYPGASSHERRDWYPADVNAILLCFSIDHHVTLMSIYNLWIHEVRTHFGKHIPVFLVGLRSDLWTIQPSTFGYTFYRLDENRKVEKFEAEATHKKYHFHGDYMECTIENKDSVIQVFQQAFLFVMESHNTA